MGVVYRATQLPLKRDVALKIISPAKAQRERSRRRFLREARVASTLRHPHVVEIYDYGEYEDTLFLTMEFAGGGSLRTWVDFDLPPLPVRKAMNIASQVADVLHAASAIPVVHRDLKPENILFDHRITHQDRIVVVDFGLAFITEPEDTETGRLTREGVVTGTPDYMSPEQARGNVDVSVATDVYSLGAILYEMLTAHPPFEGDAALVISRHLFVSPKRIRKAYPEIEIPGALDELVLAMLEKNPENRPTAEQVQNTLESIRTSEPHRMSGKEKGRVGRAARMISEPPERNTSPTSDSNMPFIVVVGNLNEEQRLIFAANGLEICELNEENPLPEKVDIVFVPGASVDRIVGYVSQGYAVVADAEAGDMDRLTQLLRGGVCEVITRPTTDEKIAGKLRKAAKRIIRQKRSAKTKTP